MTRMYRIAAGIFLSLMLALTSVSMAAARGMPVPVDTMVICAGGVMQVVPMDAEGQPTGPAHLCPDCALNLFVDVGDGYVPLAPVPVWVKIVPAIEGMRVAGRGAPVAQARGPPLSV